MSWMVLLVTVCVCQVSAAAGWGSSVLSGAEGASAQSQYKLQHHRSHQPEQQGPLRSGEGSTVCPTAHIRRVYFHTSWADHVTSVCVVFLLISDGLLPHIMSWSCDFCMCSFSAHIRRVYFHTSWADHVTSVCVVFLLISDGLLPHIMSWSCDLCMCSFSAHIRRFTSTHHVLIMWLLYV